MRTSGQRRSFREVRLGRGAVGRELREVPVVSQRGKVGTEGRVDQTVGGLRGDDSRPDRLPEPETHRDCRTGRCVDARKVCVGAEPAACPVELGQLTCQQQPGLG